MQSQDNRTTLEIIKKLIEAQLLRSFFEKILLTEYDNAAPETYNERLSLHRVMVYPFHDL